MKKLVPIMEVLVKAGAQDEILLLGQVIEDIVKLKAYQKRADATMHLASMYIEELHAALSLLIPEGECFTLPNGHCVSPHCDLHHPVVDKVN